MCQFKKPPWWIPGSRIWEKEDPDKLTYFPVRLCIKCSQVWEIPLSFTQELDIIYHFDFPTYGLKREVCNACIQSKKDKDYQSRRKS